jgi:hypothetical protein
MKAGTVMRLDKYCHLSLRLSLHQLAPVSSSVVGVETLYMLAFVGYSQCFDGEFYDIAISNFIY